MAHVLAVDLGGTKIRVARVNARGKIEAALQEPSDFASGPGGLIEQIVNLLTQVSEGETPEAVGIGSAGPLDPARGMLLSPTNFRTRGKPWGVVKLTEALESVLHVPVILENDAAAGALGEAWMGASKKFDNSVLVTLGTGLGVGVIANGQLVRAGRGLHTEAGHVFLHAGDPTAPCGCGNFGCAEAYLSGSHFQERQKKYGARIQKEYPRELAFALHSYVVCFAPEVIVLAGGFTEKVKKSLPTVKRELKALLKNRRVGGPKGDLMPDLVMSKLGADSVLLGAAGLAWHAGQGPEPTDALEML